MRNDSLATVLGTALAHADEMEIEGLLLAVGEIAAFLRSVSGPETGEEFMRTVRSSSLRLLQSGVDLHGPIGVPRMTASDVMKRLTAIESTISGSTAPSL